MAFSIPSQPPFGDQEEMEGSLELGSYGQKGCAHRDVPALPPSRSAPTASQASPWRIPLLPTALRTQGMRNKSI